MGLPDPGRAAGMVAALVSLHRCSDAGRGVGADGRPCAGAAQWLRCLAYSADLAHFGTFADALVGYTAVFVMFWNSMEQSVTQVAGQLLVGAPAAWAISRLRFHGRGAVRGLYIVLMLLPFQVTMVPSYLVLRQFGLLDTPWAVILPGIFSTFPVFIMERGFDAIPREVLESAAIDGANHWHRFWNIGIPLGVPGIISALTLGFLDAWNAIEQPITF